MTALAAATGVLFYKINKTSGYLIIPYVAWLTFASFLSNAIYELNKHNPDAVVDKGDY